MDLNQKPQLRNVLLVSLDCVRPEALGCYPQRFPIRVRIPRGEKTPNIDHLANKGHRFNQAITPAPFTPAAHASLFTGLYPPEHGIRTMFGSKLKDKVLTIAERLTNGGWRCGAVVGAGALDHEFGLNKGFAHYDDDIQTGDTNWLLGERRDAVEVTDRAIKWLKSVNDDKFFLFVHYFDAHTVHNFDPDIITKSETNVDSTEPSQSSPRSSIIRPLINLIRSASVDYFEIGLPFFIYSRYGRRHMIKQVNKIDTQIGRILNLLGKIGSLEETLIVLIADHGEDFWEHGEFDPTLRVPMIIYPKLGNQLVIEDQVSLIDIFPTIIAFLGMDSKGLDTQGLNLECLLSNGKLGRSALLSRPVYSETTWESPPPGKIELRTVYAALRSPTWKLIWDRLKNNHELYNLYNDPGEVENLIQSYPSITTDFLGQLKDLAQEMPVSTDDEANEMVVNRLKALGYI